MGGRYFLTGVQLGILMASEDAETKMKLLQLIMDDQFIGDFKAEEWDVLINEFIDKIGLYEED